MRDFNINEMCELAGLPEELTEEKEEQQELSEQEGGGDTSSVIKALRDTDYRDKEAFFKMVQLLKGLAVASEKDDKAKQYLSAVSDALTSAAKKVLGESLEEGAAQNTANMAKKISGYIGSLESSLGRVKQNNSKFAKGGATNYLDEVIKDISHMGGVCKKAERDIEKGLDSL